MKVRKADLNHLEENWELFQEQLKESPNSLDYDLSTGCYVTFGTYGISVFKYERNHWYRATVNNWKQLSFDQFLEALASEKWEKIQ